MDGLTAQFVDGELLQRTSTQSTTTSAATNKTGETKVAGSNSLDKEAFLQLLVAQMKYQDPLEPTSNTEYISQYATFSELEQMQNMSSNMTLSRASELVGKEVIIESTSDSGKQSTVQGYVEKVVYNSNKAFLSIDGSLYSIDDLKQVVDDEYKAGMDTIEDIQKIIDKLPKPEQVTMNDLQDVSSLYTAYTSMTSYQLSLMDNDTVSKIEAYISRATELGQQLSEAAERAAEALANGEEDKDDAPSEDEIISGDTEEV